MTPWYADDAVTVWHGDCLDVLAGMADCSVDAVVTDPPYGLEFMGREWDSFKTYNGGNPNMKPQGATIHATEEGEWQPGRAHGIRQKNPRCRRCGKLLRGNGSCKCSEPIIDTRTAEPANQYQYWCEQWASECLRVLKPGGHLIAFGGTRTSHRLVSGIEDAGFEIRDGMVWLYGSGFPKSRDVSKAIDRAAGAERKIMGRSNRAIGPSQERGYGGTATFRETGWEDGNLVTAPATEEARRWNGWGTALKPGHEPVCVARKPLSEGSVAANVLRWGTGGINVDAGRVEGVPPSVPQPKFGVKDDGAGTFNYRAGEGRNGEMSSAAGRWPPNVALDGDAAADLDRQSGTLRLVIEEWRPT